MSGQFRKFAEDYLLPPAATRLGERIMSSIQRRQWLETEEGRLARQSWAENRGLYACEADRASDRTVFILACGPSIASHDLTPLIGADCISLANFPVHELTPRLAPRYHVFAPHHQPFTEAEFFAWFDEVDKRLPETTTMLLPLNCRAGTEAREIFSKNPRHYITFQQCPLEAWKIGTNPFTSPFVSMRTVGIGALLLAIGLGYKRIALVGFDMTWTFRADRAPVHFYEDDRGLRPSDPGRLRMVEQFENHAKVWKQFARVRDIAAGAGVAILNCTDGGLLDVFPRASLEEALRADDSRRAKIAAAS